MAMHVNVTAGSNGTSTFYKWIIIESTDRFLILIEATNVRQAASQLTVLEYTKINYHISLTKGLSEAVSHRRTEGQRRQRPKEKG